MPIKKSQKCFRWRPSAYEIFLYVEISEPEPKDHHTSIKDCVVVWRSAGGTLVPWYQPTVDNTPNHNNHNNHTARRFPYPKKKIMTLAEDLGELGLSPSDQDDRRKIRKTYLILVRTRHPDKNGGSKDAFQRLSNAYERLAHPQDDEEVEEAESSDDDFATTDSNRAHHHSNFSSSYAGQWDQYYGEFFNGYDEDQFDGFDSYGREFRAWETSQEERRWDWSRYHQEELRRGRDFRDRKAKAGEPKCMFCGVNAPIEEAEAEAHGIDWEEYARSANVEGYPPYNTCWCCKTNNKSVLTENQACKKFARKLDFHIRPTTKGCPYRPVFSRLKIAGRFFHHQPVTARCDGPTRNSTYYWYPDLEREALARGWKANHWKMKDEVPWRRKDMPRDIVPVVSPSPLMKKRRRNFSDEDDHDGDTKSGVTPKKLEFC